MLSGMAALNGGLGATGLTNGTAGTMDALTQAYSGIQQYAAAALPTLYSQSLLQQQSAAGSQKEGRCPACLLLLGAVLLQGAHRPIPGLCWPLSHKARTIPSTSSRHSDLLCPGKQLPPETCPRAM